MNQRDSSMGKEQKSQDESEDKEGSGAVSRTRGY